MPAGVESVKCVKTGEEINQGICEECVSNRICDPICAKRGLIFGRDNDCPSLWELTKEEAMELEMDLNWFWESKPQQKYFSENEKTGYKKNRANISENKRWNIWERDNFTCQSCGARRFLTIDHVVPLAKGGTNEESNLQTLCHSCNAQKGSKE